MALRVPQPAQEPEAGGMAWSPTWCATTGTKWEREG